MLRSSSTFYSGQACCLGLWHFLLVVCRRRNREYDRTLITESCLHLPTQTCAGTLSPGALVRGLAGIKPWSALVRRHCCCKSLNSREPALRRSRLSLVLRNTPTSAVSSKSLKINGPVKGP